MRVAVFCGSSLGRNPLFAEVTERLARALVARGADIVYGGGSIGLMGVLADAALAAGGEVVGVIPAFLKERELGHAGLAELRVVETICERKAIMTALSDAFVTLPGGFGTLEEFFEVLTGAQLGLHPKPCALLSPDDYYEPLLRQIRHLSEEGFIAPRHEGLVIVEQSPEILVERLFGAYAAGRVLEGKETPA